ncbi:hypothetical protein KFL_000220330 [Klebsormidium nitens]|uniref:MYND-type domain-containing protein n=1 Tax=Klebsormidium nitens TaxID=105231 RepID=A0A1Y1HMR5_KLENI|nr:hypothetical protein KFL_000220330 [Klebsormidium nitens]|eukprot:GAQ79002.1 hypothetical protein KFL_000220330 [Klebsormidium nitens]
MFPFPGMNGEDAQALRDILLQAQHYMATNGPDLKKKPSDADRAKERKKLLKRFKTWQLVETGMLDLGRGERFKSRLSGHDPFENFHRGGGGPRRRSPYTKDEFGMLAEARKRALRVQAGVAKADYRLALVKEYGAVFDIEDSPQEFVQASGTVFAEIRGPFQAQAKKPASEQGSSAPNNQHSETANQSGQPGLDNPSQSGQPHSDFQSVQPAEEGMWAELSEEELGAAGKLKGVLDELVEIACCGHAVAEAFDYDDPRGSICNHAARALTPFLPLCSDEQLRKLALLMGEWDRGEYVVHHAKDMFAAWDLPSECPWVWDMVLETTAAITKGKTEEYFGTLRPILLRNEPWGGPMHDEHILACAVSLCRDDFGVERINDELRRGIGGPGGHPGARNWMNGCLFSELKRLHVADADDLVIKASKLEAYAECLDGNYLTWLKELDLPASNEERIATAKAAVRKLNIAPGTALFQEKLAENTQQVRRWVDSTGGWRQSTPEARAKEALAAARRAFFGKAVRVLLAKDPPTAADVRRELLEYRQKCAALEARAVSGARNESGASGGSTREAPGESTREGDATAAKVCDHCGEKAREGKKLQRCGVCRKAKYCGRECQSAAWRKGHREACKGQTS